MIAPSLTKDMKTTALLDGDIIAYKAAAACDAQMENERFAIMLADKITGEWVAGSTADQFKVCLSLGRSFRYEVFPEYKAHRKGQSRPTYLDNVKDYMRVMYEVEERDTLEADDIMGILATDDTVETPIIVTIDKDLQQIPGWHYNPDKGRFPFHVREDEAWLLEHVQWAVGDATDGFRGIQGVGPAKALKRLRIHSTASEATEDMWRWYAELGYSAEYASQMRACSYILRTENPSEN